MMDPGGGGEDGEGTSTESLKRKTKHSGGGMGDLPPYPPPNFSPVSYRHHPPPPWNPTTQTASGHLMDSESADSGFQEFQEADSNNGGGASATSGSADSQQQRRASYPFPRQAGTSAPELRDHVVQLASVSEDNIGTAVTTTSWSSTSATTAGTPGRERHIRMDSRSSSSDPVISPPPPYETLVDTTSVVLEDEEEDEGSLLGMLFRRSTVRRRPPPPPPRPEAPDYSRGSGSDPITLIGTNEATGPHLVPFSSSSVSAATDVESGRWSIANDSRGAIEPSRPSDSAVEPSAPPPTVASTGPPATGLSHSSQRRSVRFALRNPVFASRDQSLSASAGSVPPDLIPVSEHTAVSAETQTSSNETTDPDTPVPSPDPGATPPPSMASREGRPASPVERRETDDERRQRVGGYWPHSASSLMASLTCTVGMYAICRFAYLSFQYGGGFILQFLMLSVVFGLPMLSFQMSLGQYMGAGIVDMWKVSPVFTGVGVSAIIAMALIGIYNVIPVSWMFVYFRDSFVSNLTFKWGECRNAYPLEECQRLLVYNSSDVIKKAIPAYFQNRVLQRQTHNVNASQGGNSSDLVFENVFNLAVIWMIIFICLSKGVKSYGKVVLAFGLFSLLSFYLLAIEILRRASSGAELIISLHTDMSEFFFNGWSWLAAAREVFFVWGVNGAALMQIASHNKFRYNLKRDCALVIILTLSVILLSAFLGCACIYIIYKTDRYTHRYVPSSYETTEYSQFLFQASKVQQLNLDIRDFMSTNYLVGVESTTFTMDTTKASGYQPIRFATELYPMAVAALGPKRISSFWPVLFYLCLITFGIAQQLAIWKCVVEGVIAFRPQKLRQWETSITFLACVFGFLLGLPFTTHVGVFMVYFMDICVGSTWWIMVILLAQVFALLLVRGRPFTSDEIVIVLTSAPSMKKWFAPIISFSWNVVLPVAFLVLAVTSFKLGGFGRMFSWTEYMEGYSYWPIWAKQIGALIQVTPIVLIAFIGVAQAIRYMGHSPGEFTERFERMLRPVTTFLPYENELSDLLHSDHNSQASQEPETPVLRDDPPPKYTPPPSYNTATGLKILKRLNSLRMSFRRSQRVIRRDNSHGGSAIGATPAQPVTGDVPIEMRGTGMSSGVIAAGAPAIVTMMTMAEVAADVPPSYAAVVETAAGGGQHNTRPN